ncbi:MAG: hypothetical protein QXZ22_08620 [Sulfolobales archaeon]
MIAIDLDSKNQLQLLKVYFNARHISDKVEVFETQRGYHILVWGIKHNIDLRRYLCDDTDRIENDLLRDKYTQNVLFNIKDNKENEFITNILSLPFNSKITKKFKYKNKYKYKQVKKS